LIQCPKSKSRRFLDAAFTAAFTVLAANFWTGKQINLAWWEKGVSRRFSRKAAGWQRVDNSKPLYRFQKYATP